VNLRDIEVVYHPELDFYTFGFCKSYYSKEKPLSTEPYFLSYCYFNKKDKPLIQEYFLTTEEEISKKKDT
jgi:hypothetical protein